MPVDDTLVLMSDDEIKAFPLGVVRLDSRGTIHLFNPAEEAFVNRRGSDTIGLNYFREVAPCAAVKNFEGRFHTFVESKEARRETFGFFYPFDWGHKQVTITLLKAPRDSWIYVVTEIGSVADGDSPECEA